MPNCFLTKKEKWLDSINLACYFNPLILSLQNPVPAGLNRGSVL
jgi:hypothetical protein